MAKVQVKFDKVVKSARNQLGTWKESKREVKLLISSLKNLSEQHQSVSLSDHTLFGVFPELSTRVEGKIISSMHQTLEHIKRNWAAMQESSSTLERQSQKAQELLDQISEMTSLDYIHLCTSQSFSMADQTEWLRDAAFFCQRELSNKEELINRLLKSQLSPKQLGCACEEWDRGVEGMEADQQDVEAFLEYTCWAMDNQ